MQRYEILDENDNVINTVIASQDFVEQAYPGRFRLVGPAGAASKLFDQLGVYSLFTLAERGAIFQAAQGNGIVASFLAMLRDAKNGIRLDHPDFIDGVNYLGTDEALGTSKLSAERIAQVLNGEQPTGV